MSNITAADVAKLRKSTGAGMMDCKKALEIRRHGDGSLGRRMLFISQGLERGDNHKAILPT